MKRLPVFVPGLVAALAVGAAALLAIQNAALRRELAAVRAGLPQPVAEVAVAAPEESANPSRSADDDASADAGPLPAANATSDAAPAATPRAVPPRRFDGRDRGTEFFARVLADPDARAAMLSRLKGEMDRRFGDYFVELGLNEVQIEALRSLLAERQMVRMESRLLRRAAETDQERTEADAWRDATLASTEEEINAILGPGGVDKLQAYLEHAPQRQVVDAIATRASYLGAPLSEEANRRLQETVRQVTTENPLPELPGPGRGPWGGGEGDFGPITPENVSRYLQNLRAQNERIIDEARSYLTRPQLEALADQQIEQMQQVEAQLNFMLRNPDARRRGFRGRDR